MHHRHDNFTVSIYAFFVALQADAIAAQRISMVDDISHHVEPSVTDVQVQAHFEVNPVTVDESSQNDKCIQVMPSVSDNAVQVELLMDDNTFGGKPLTKAVMVQADVEYPAMIHGGVQTEETDQCYSCVNLRVDKLKLQACIGPLSEQHLKDDDKKVNFYTGLPTFSMLDFIVKFVSSGVPFIGKLSRFQEILLVLMKLRLNLEEQDLAYRFCVSQSTVSNVFRKWIYTMAEQLSFLIHWPSREQMMTSMPMVFRKFFKNCICILDCTEVFIEHPANLQARSHTWSEYKHHNTIKVLIAVTPQGTISFISEAWGGRASDKFITEHSGVLDKLEHGDLVLADRGFTIEDSVGLYCAKLCCPPFTKGKKQLSRNEVDYAREISHVRIHVERVIGQMKKKFKLLEGVIPINMLNEKTPADDKTFIDCIFTVCAALCNACTSVVPLTHAHIQHT